MDITLLMIFARLPLSSADGAILAHAVDLGPEGMLKKGHLLDQQTLKQIAAAGHETVLAAKLEPGDIIEDEAAEILAGHFTGENVSAKPPFTGRSNLYAQKAGIARINRTLLNKINRIDPSITVATVKDYDKVDAGQMLATIKIIPFSTRTEAIDQATEFADQEDTRLLAVHPFLSRKIGVISTRLKGTSDKLVAKSEKVLEARLLACNNQISERLECDHHEDALADAIVSLKDKGCDLVMIFGASAITDTRDIIPTAITKSNGQIDHFGMPVDPGNLLLLGQSDDCQIIGLPGCSRSPKLNGFDWIMERLLAGLSVTADDIMGMGEGGLLKEIASRPQPRAGKRTSTQMKKTKIAVLLLAAGQSRRMGKNNKLLALIEGKPMIRHVAEQALASKADHVLMVTGHEADSVMKSVWDIDIPSVHNPDFADGLSTSLKLGFQVLSENYDGVLVCLGDMPFVSFEILNQLIDQFDPEEGRSIVIPTVSGKRGNPVLISSQYADEISVISGDMGAKALINDNESQVHTVEIDSPSIFADIDTPEILLNLAALKK
ncbi:NTP transferase domain-containing protein [Sneathiella aquimaris]|uniref:NTP transferase domain-containing protein n=2 Tax=Sneathiella aquimaris TaxID=2599305 RepID=UPI00146DBAED|nr:molybdopterin-binding/glycosyltransferase family 2 protein [Sneathiella aquimaris]